MQGHFAAFRPGVPDPDVCYDGPIRLHHRVNVCILHEGQSAQQAFRLIDAPLSHAVSLREQEDPADDRFPRGGMQAVGHPA